MDKRRIFHYVLIGVLVALLYMAFLIVKPFLTYLILGLMLTYLLHPLYLRLTRKMKSKEKASVLMVLLVLLLIILPSVFIITKLVGQSVSAYNAFKSLDLMGSDTLDNVLAPLGLSMDEMIQQVAGKVKDYFVLTAPNILGSIAEVLLGLFVMFFFMFFAFRDGEKWIKLARQSLPLEPEHRERLFARMGSITSAVMYGQFLTAVIQGSLGGLMFLAFGIPNAIFWGVIMIMFSFIPFLGTPLIWIPAAIIELVQGNYVAGIGILLVGGILVMNIDNLLRPYLIASKDKISPVLVLIGVLGGLKLFGFIGILLGPLLLALLQTVIELFKEKPKTVRKKVSA